MSDKTSSNHIINNLILNYPHEYFQELSIFLSLNNIYPISISIDGIYHSFLFEVSNKDLSVKYISTEEYITYIFNKQPYLKKKIIYMAKNSNINISIVHDIHSILTSHLYKNIIKKEKISYHKFKDISVFHSYILNLIKFIGVKNYYGFNQLSHEEKIEFLNFHKFSFEVENKAIIITSDSRQLCHLIMPHTWCLYKSLHYWNLYHSKNKKQSIILYITEIEFIGISVNNMFCSSFDQDNYQLSFFQIFKLLCKSKLLKKTFKELKFSKYELIINTISRFYSKKDHFH